MTENQMTSKLKAALYKPWSYTSPDVPKRLAARQWTKWMFTDASAVDCPHCGAPKFFFCTTPKGRRAWPPHPKRLDALQAIGYGDANKVAALTLDQVLDQTRKEKQKEKAMSKKAKHSFVVTVGTGRKTTRDEARAALKEVLGDETPMLILSDYFFEERGGDVSLCVEEDKPNKARKPSREEE